MQSGIFGMYFKAGVSDDKIQDAINSFYLDNKSIIEGGFFFQFTNQTPTDELKAKAETYRDELTQKKVST